MKNNLCSFVMLVSLFASLSGELLAQEIRIVHEGYRVPYTGVLMPDKEFRKLIDSKEGLKICERHLKEKPCGTNIDVMGWQRTLVGFLAGFIVVSAINASHR